MKKIIRLTENDVERLVKKIIKEEGVNPEWFEKIQPSEAQSFLYELFHDLRTNKQWIDGLTYYVDGEGNVLMIDNIDMEDKNVWDNTLGMTVDEGRILYVDNLDIADKLEEMGLSDEEMESLLIKMLKDMFNREVNTVEFRIPGSYMSNR